MKQIFVQDVKNAKYEQEYKNTDEWAVSEGRGLHHSLHQVSGRSQSSAKVHLSDFQLCLHNLQPRS